MRELLKENYGVLQMLIDDDQIFGQGISLAGEPGPTQIGTTLYFGDHFEDSSSSASVEIDISEASANGWLKFSLMTSDYTTLDKKGNPSELLGPELLMESGCFRIKLPNVDLSLPVPNGSLVKFRNYISVYVQKSDADVTGIVSAYLY